MMTNVRTRTATDDLGFGTTQKSLDVSASLRKLANPNALLVATRLFEKNSATFRELQKETMMSTNALTHAIYVLKISDIIVKSVDRYYLTNYGVILLEAINQIREELKEKDQNLFEPDKGAA